MTTALRKAENAYTQTAIDDEVVVMTLADGSFYSLSGTARAVWEAIDGARSRDAVVAALAADFGAEPAAIAPEVDAFIAELADAGLLARD